ncbi:Sel1 repeat domain-containing protein [Babesia divergens]|uniref:Sel1 repeat domain-containing protein n=1 Tax=Babesia divergens TaxID=32595 RepID=A0AAD9LLV5_BABDI|nr:Sel1 repeat domain-containing protein [Babesia divergens]
MLHQYNGRMLRLGRRKVPRRLEVMLHVLNSPILHDSVFNRLNSPEGPTQGLPFLAVPLRLPRGGAAYNLVVAVLANDAYALRRYSGLKKNEHNWSTYLDNEAAYTYLWRLLSRQVKINRQQHPKNMDELSDQLLYCYRNDNNEILIFKYRLTMDRNMNGHFAGLISQWSLGRLPVHSGYMDLLNDDLSLVDRSRYPLEMFDNIGKISSFVSGEGDTDVSLLTDILDLPILKPSMSLEECLDNEAKEVAEITLRFAETLMARMLEKHDIPVYLALRHRKFIRRIHGVAGPLRIIRHAMNEQLGSMKTPPSTFEFEASQQHEEIEEILFESSVKFNPYWSMKNDTLYKSSDIVNFYDVKNIGLLFEPEAFVRRLINMRGEQINFLEIHDILHRLTTFETPVKRQLPFINERTCKVVTSTVDKVEEQYKSLPNVLRNKLVAKCRCLLVFLYLVGVVDRNGELDFPNGWPRNVTKSLMYITDGVASSCGLCNAILGLLSGIGYPPVVDNMYAWETRKTHAESAIYQLLVTSKWSKHTKNTEYFDKTLLSYISGHYKDDDISRLAVGYYIYSGIGNPSRLLDDVNVRSGVERYPKSVGSNCIEALPFVIDAAKAAMHSRTQPNLDEAHAEYRSRSYSEFVKNLANMGDTDALRVMGDFHYAGHEGGNIRVDVPRAMEYWTMAAQQGDPASSLTIANHLIHMMNREEEPDWMESSSHDIAEDISVTAEALHLEGFDRPSMEAAAESYLRIAANSNNHVAASTARFLMSRHGIGASRDPVEAARHLKEGADRGDATSQMLMGHAYAGLLKDVTPPDGKNVFMALEYYRSASKSGNIVATFNTAVLTLHGYDLKYNSSLERCKASFGLFQSVGRHALMPEVVTVLSKRAAIRGDHLGHILMNLFLSEMGDAEAHIRAAKHFKTSNSLCYVRGSKPPESSDSDTPTRGMGIFTPFQQQDQASGPSPCHLFYARRSGYEANGGSPLIFAEALLEEKPQESVEWVVEAKVKNEPKANYLYATMLEGGVGMSQDCQASYNYYSSMTESKDFTTKMIGFLCINRGRVSHLLSCWPSAYEWFVNNFYDYQLVSHLLAPGYKPCRYDMPTIRILHLTEDRLITAVFVLVLIFITIVYLRMN